MYGMMDTSLMNSCVSQTWLIGNTASDVLIAAAMLYHVIFFVSDR